MANLLESVAFVFRTEIFEHSGVWAQEKRVLSRSESSEQGPFNIHRSPFFIPIYKVIASGKYSRIVIVCSSQQGKTEFILNRCGHKLDTSPVPITFLFPTEGLAKSFSKNRFQKMLRSTPSLYSKMAKGKLDNILEKYISGVRVGFAWATSAVQLCSHSAGEVYIDERDRMEDDVQGEGDPVELAATRGTTYPDFLSIITSTPTIEGRSAIMKLFDSGTKWLFKWQCPFCKERFSPWFENLKWPKGATPAVAEKEAFVECPHCNAHIEDKYRLELNKTGYFVDVNNEIVDVSANYGSQTASFRIPGLCSPYKTFGELAAFFIEADESNDAYRIKAVINTRFGETYKIAGEVPNMDEMEPLRTRLQSLEVPEWALLLTAAVDVQKRGLYIVIRAWGPASRSQMVYFAFLPGDTNNDNVWDDLGNILNSAYSTKDGKQSCYISKMAIDCRYREEMVFSFVHRHREKAIACRGHATQIAPVRMVSVEISQDGRLKKGGIQLLNINDSYFKLWVYNRITRGPDVEDSWLIPEDSTEEYIKQVLSEEFITLPSGRQKWVVKNSKQNHALDCEKMSGAIAYFLNFRLLKAQEKTNKSKTRNTSVFQGV